MRIVLSAMHIYSLPSIVLTARPDMVGDAERFVYSPRMYFTNWVNRLSGAVTYPVEDGVVASVWEVLDTWNPIINYSTVDGALRYLAKNVDKSFSQYYPHSYQIANTLRGE